MLSLVTIKACNLVVDADTQETDWLIEYQSALRNVFLEATALNHGQDVSDMTQLGDNIRAAYVAVLGDYADLEAFERGYERAFNPDVRSKETSRVVDEYIGIIIRQSQSPEEAITLLDSMLSTYEFNDEERLALITTREFLAYLQYNGEFIDELRTATNDSSATTQKGVTSSLIQSMNEECEEKTIQQIVIDPETQRPELVVVVIMDCPNGGGTDWKCFMGTVGYTGSGALAGCVGLGGVFAIPTVGLGFPAGCTLGAVMGGFFGFFMGYAEHCFN